MRDNYEIPSLGINLKLSGQIADELSYTRTSDCRNCLSIVKYYQAVLPRHSTHAGGFKRVFAQFMLKNFL